MDFNGIVYESDALQHYGVLGMKWGMRKARKNGGTYTYRSHSQKKYSKKAARAQKKGNAYKAALYGERAKRAAALDAKEQARAKNYGTGAELARRSLLYNGNANKAYEQHRAMGSSKGEAMAYAYLGGKLGSYGRKAHNIRKGDAAIKRRYKNR